MKKTPKEASFVLSNSKKNSLIMSTSLIKGLTNLNLTTSNPATPSEFLYDSKTFIKILYDGK